MESRVFNFIPIFTISNLTMVNKVIINRLGFMKLAGLILMLPVIVLMLSGCKDSGSKSILPGNVLSDSVMVSILTDIFLIEGVMIQLEYIQQKEQDAGILFYQMVMEKHGVSREQFRESLEYYATEPQLFDKLYDKVVQNLVVIQDALKKEAEATIDTSQGEVVDGNAESSSETE